MTAALAALAACGPGSGPGEGGVPSPTPTPATPAPITTAPSPAPTAEVTTATPRPTSVATRVTVRRTGGFAGVDQSLVVETDGRWRYAGAPGPGAGPSRPGRLGATELDRLHALLADASFGSAFYRGGCADAFQYTVQAGRVRMAYDDCGTVPARAATQIVALLAGATPF